MKIIDAHIHFCSEFDFDRLALAAGHENTERHLRSIYGELGLCHAVVMGNRDLEPSSHEYPDFMSYCIGLDGPCYLGENRAKAVERVEAHLRRKNCVGIKLYPGYNPQYVTDPLYAPFYELAQTYAKPVAIHTGETASSRAQLKYSHPLTVDELAVAYRQVQFVLCHYGNPWVVDAAAVVFKNPNVCADLSGILEHELDVREFIRDNTGYVEHLRTWIHYVGDYDRFLFGTDWPLVNIGNYIEFVAHLIPERHHDKVFYQNANRVYSLGV